MSWAAVMVEVSMNLNQKHEPIALDQINRKNVLSLQKHNRKWFNKSVLPLRVQRQPVLVATNWERVNIIKKQRRQPHNYVVK